MMRSSSGSQCALFRHFNLDSAPLIHALALDCIELGDDDSTEVPEWVQSNRRFVDCVVR